MGSPSSPTTPPCTSNAQDRSGVETNRLHIRLYISDTARCGRTGESGRRWHAVHSARTTSSPGSLRRRWSWLQSSGSASGVGLAAGAPPQSNPQVAADHAQTCPAGCVAAARPRGSQAQARASRLSLALSAKQSVSPTAGTSWRQSPLRPTEMRQVPRLYLSVSLSLCLSVSLSLCLSVSLSLCLSVSVSLSLCLCLCLSVCLSCVPNGARTSASSRRRDQSGS
jgi:hypothetical protein